MISFIDENGNFIVSEPDVCRVDSVVSYYPGKLYVPGGVGYSKEPMWCTPFDTLDTSNLRMAGAVDDESSMEILRLVQLYPENNERVRVDANEMKRAIPSSVGSISYDETIYETFNMSQLAYRYLGGIRYLDNENQRLNDELQAEKTRNDELEERLNELERRLDKLTNPRPEYPHDDRKTTPQPRALKVFPNPTKDVLQVEINTEEKLENAKLRIIDAMGNMVLEQKINAELPIITLNTSNLNIQSGQYFCTLISAGKVVDTQTVTIIK